MGVAFVDVNSIYDRDINASAAIQRTKLQQDANAVYAIPPTIWRRWDSLDQVLFPTSTGGSADDLLLVTGTLATNSPVIKSADVSASTTLVTQFARCMFALPVEYEAGQTVLIRTSAIMEVLCDTSATIDFQVYESNRQAGVGADICATAAISINTTTWANHDFTITATNLNPGELLDIRMAVAANASTTNTGNIASIGAVELLLDVKG